jgi:hypothetical protein
MKRLTLIGVVLTLAVVAAPAKSNFSGVWNLNTATSDFGPLPSKPEKMVMTIEQADTGLQITQDITGPQGKFTAKFKYSTDGKEVSNVNGPTDLKSTARWDGDTLVVESSGKTRGNDVKLIDKWTLDGKTLKQARHVIVTQGEFDQTYVFDKQ